MYNKCLACYVEMSGVFILFFFVCRLWETVRNH